MLPAPVLVVTYPVLVEFAANADELTPLALARPLFLGVVAAGLGWMALRAAGWGELEADLLGVVAVGVAWWGDAWWAVLGLLASGGLYGPPASLLAVLLAVLGLRALGRRVAALPPGGESRQALGRFVRATAVALLAFGALQAFEAARRHADPPRLAAPALGPVAGPAEAPRPDVYLVVLDGYLRDDFLAARYGFDNTPFLEALEARGFVVARRAQANYAWTSLAVSSMLNLGYLDFPEEQVARGEAGYGSFARMLRDSALQRALEARGYRSLSVAGGDWKFDQTSYDVSVPSRWGELERLLFARTAPGALFPELDAYARRAQVDASLDALAPPDSGPPRFALVHVLAPHPSFVFDPEGGTGELMPLLGIPDSGPAMDQAMGRGWYRKRYLEQLAYVNRRVLEGLDRVLAAEGREAWVVLTGDHGARSYQDAAGPVDMLREVFSVLSAYRAPPAVRARIRSDTGPINGVRALAGPLLGLELEPLPERSFVSALDRPWERMPVPAFGRLGEEPGG